MHTQNIATQLLEAMTTNTLCGVNNCQISLKYSETLYFNLIKSLHLTQKDCNMPEQVLLQWNDFRDHVNKAFGNLIDDNDC